MSASGTKVIITQLIVDSSGAKTGVEQFEASLAKARAAANDAGAAMAGGPNSFDGALKKWTQSLAATDPVLRAQVQMQQQLQRQMDIGNRAVQLGISTQQAAEAQLERVRVKYQGYVTEAERGAQAGSAFGKSMSFITAQAGPLIGVLSAAAIVNFGKQIFDHTAALNDQAAQVGVTVEAFQAYRAAMQESGIANDQADTLLAKLTQTFGIARQQAGPARDAFNELGLSAHDLVGGVEQALPKIAQALLSLPDATERARLETDLFGRSGQKLESALRTLADPTADLEQKFEALGLVLKHDVTQGGDDASKALNKAFERMQNSWAPEIVSFTGLLADMAEALNTPVKKGGVLDSLFEAANFSLGAVMPFPVPVLHAGQAPNAMLKNSPLLANVSPSATQYLAPANDNGFSNQAEKTYLDQQKVAADLAGLSVTRRAQEVATIGLANAKLQDGTAILKDQDGHLVKQVTSYDQARQLIGAAATKNVENLALITAQGDQWRKVRETFTSYLGSLTEEVRVAGESVAQRETELAVIKGAQIYQKQRGVEEKDIVQTYDAALTKLSPIQVAEIQRKEAAKLTAGFQQEISDQLALSNVYVSADRDARDLALQITQKQLDLGRALTDQERQRLELVQRQTDAGRLRDYVDQLKDEVTLAGLSADEREREQAAMDAMRITHGLLTQDQQREITGLVQIRQETERWQGVIDSITGPCEEFPDEFLEDPDISAEIAFELQEIQQ